MGQFERVSEWAAILRDLHEKWLPHPGQIPIGQALFYDRAKKIFVCFGRNAGKTQLASYSLWRWALENPGTSNYIFEPFNTQAKEILWASGTIQSFAPSHYVESVNNTEMRITLKNGSFIKVSGADNEEAFRGIKPTGLVIFDEYKDIKESFMQAFEPNLAAYDPPVIYIGTPPEFENHFTERMDHAKESPDWKFFEAPTSVNPFISKQWLANKKAELYAMGEEETWIREYEARFVIGGKRSVFPQFLKLQFNPLNLPKDSHKWTMLIGLDPAASSIFGVIFCLFNPYTKKIIVFDEIYQDDPQQMTARNIYMAVNEKIKQYRDRVRQVRWIYDEAARYFQSEIYEINGGHWELEKSRKSDLGVDGYIAIIRSVLNKGLVEVTDNCVKFIWEMQSYVKNEKGRIPKENDHLINAFSYVLQAMGFNLDSENKPKPIPIEEQRRGYSPESEVFGREKYVDFDESLISNSYEDID